MNTPALRLIARRAALLAGTVGLTAGGIASFGIGPSASAAASGLQWTTCDSSFRCATLDVPADYAKPQDGSISLSVVELPATSRAAKGDIVLNPGGPGASGVQFLTQSATSFPAALRRSFNLVSFDPRGVGSSDPVRCSGAAGIRSLIALNPAPVTASQIHTVVTGVKAFVRSCEQHTAKIVLDNVSTLDTARDLDRLRAALGQRRLNYFGFSYGTYIGELYVKLFPDRVRAMVLDGVVDPALSTTASDLQQAVGFERELDDFYRWCPTNRTCTKELSSDPKATFDALLSRFEHGETVPAHLAPQYGGTVHVGYGIFLTAIASALYAQQEWPDLARTIYDAVHHSGALAAALAYSYAGLQPDGTFSNMLAANNAINCEDSPAPTSVGAYPALARAMGKAAPVFGPSEAWGTLSCTYWPVHPTAGPAPIVNRGKDPILVVGSTGDPATPYSGAQHVAVELKNAELLTRTGTGHTAYLFSSCIRTWTDRYLETLALPPKGTVCPTN